MLLMILATAIYIALLLPLPAVIMANVMTVGGMSENPNVPPRRRKSGWVFYYATFAYGIIAVLAVLLAWVAFVLGGGIFATVFMALPAVALFVMLVSGVVFFTS